MNPSSGAAPTWNDLTLNPVVNDAHALNYYGLDISSITIDTHDPTGNTVYVTVAGIESPGEEVQVVYRSTNGGASWTDITANLPAAPANSLAVDPQNANTVYVATDQGVYFTTEVANCAQALSNCWSAFGSGLPDAPALRSAPLRLRSTQVLVAATYGRGIWQTPLWSAGTGLTSASVNPSSLTFPSQAFDTTSTALTVTLENTGSIALAPTSISMSGNFSETDNCVNASVAAGASCTIQVTFTPQATGPLTGEMTIYANVYGGQLTVDLNGTGAAAGVVTLTPSTVNFGQVEAGTTSAPLPVTVANSSAAAIPISSVSITAPFAIFPATPAAQSALRRTPIASCRSSSSPRKPARDRPAHLYRRGGNANRGAERDRRGPAHRHSESHVAHLPGDRGRPAFRGAAGHHHQYRRLAAHFDLHLGERAVSGVQHVRHATGGGRGLHHQRDIRSHSDGPGHRHAHHRRRPAHSIRSFGRDGPCAAGL